MYLISRNNLFYKGTVTDVQRYEPVPATRHVFVRDVEQAMEFKTRREAYKLVESICGTQVVKLEDKPIGYTLSDLKATSELMFKLLMLVRVFPDDIKNPQKELGYKLSTAEMNIRKILQGKSNEVAKDIIERLEIMLADAPLDESFLGWESQILNDKAERQQRWKELAQPLWECKEKYYENNWLDFATDMKLAESTIRGFFSKKDASPSGIAIYKIEKFLEENGIEVRTA